MKPVLLLLAVSAFAQSPVLETKNSPQAALKGVPVSAVRIHDGFWSPRQKVNLEVSLPSLHLLFEEKGIVDNFRRLSGRKQVARRGPLYTDSDVYKWIEAIGFALQSGPQPELRRLATSVIDDIVAAQEQNGYLNTFYSKENLAQRHNNMRHGHELYCLGHMVQAGLAWRRATGESKLLDSSVRMVEYLLREFGPPPKKPIFEGHPEIELALIELYRETGDKRYLDFASYLLESDDRNLKVIPARELVYLFTGKPFTSRTRLEGHAVRAMYASAGAADYYLETGSPAYRKTLDILWDDMDRRKMYLTGGVGSRASGEAFGEPYELPNQQAYTESCAAIATMFFNWRMMQAAPDSKYLDSFERALYNGANSGLALAGNLYCYRNPLEHTGNPDDKIRNPWYDTTCCPPNLQRILASLPGYFYSTNNDGLWVHLFDNNTLNWKLPSGPISLTQVTKYPWAGQVEFQIQQAPAAEFTLFLRKPVWAANARLSLAGKPLTAPLKNGYFAIRRAWKSGDRLTLDLGLTERLTRSNPHVRENLGKVAVERGPLVYAMEGLDQPAGASLFDWVLDNPRTPFRAEYQPNFLGGVTVLRHAAVRPKQSYREAPLYQNLAPLNAAELVSGEITLIPYYTFHNREVTPMQVWVPYR